jgi:hypothetical protein
MITLLSDYLDREALRKALKIGSRSLAALERRGLPSFMLGGRRMYRLSAARAWLDGQAGVRWVDDPPDPPRAA